MTTISTQGYEVRQGSRWLRSAIELLSSMRFAIALLTVICIASVIGTVITQHQPFNNYVNQFGPFWARVFETLNLYSVYSAWWFLLILAFLVISTSLCIARHTPKILADLKSYKENIHVRALQAFGYKAEAVLPQEPAQAARSLGEKLAGKGWKVKLQQRQGDRGGWMVAAKKGGANKIGYLAAHSAIVLICLGGLLDGDLMVRMQTWFNGKQPFNGAGMIADVPPQHRLSTSNPTFRGNLFVPEGSTVDTAILLQKDGVLIQELPFALELKKFIVEYYPTGMPRVFASEVVIHDRETGEAIPQRIEVNHPASYKGIQIYQSSFEDGGSPVKLKAVGMGSEVAPFSVDTAVGRAVEITNGEDKRTLEVTDLRTINVENFGNMSSGPVDVRSVDLRQTLQDNLGSAQNRKDHELRNVGPSVIYKLRDSAGQAREFSNYMLPVMTGEGGPPEFLFGVRNDTAENFRYLRIPADDNNSLEEFQRLRHALNDPALRAEAVRRYVAQSTGVQNQQVQEQLALSASRVMDLFAGDPANLDAARRDSNSEAARSFGLQAIARFIEQTIPAEDQQRFGDVLLRMLNGSMVELLQLSRERAKLPALDMNEQKHRAWLAQAVVALSDAPLYPEPVLFQLENFTQVQASVFQVTRAPGKWVVYLGCLFLILGVFAMLYITERRVWVWVRPAAQDGQEAASGATMALSSNRRNLDSDKEFDTLKQYLLGEHQS
ncbi:MULTISPECIES: cytochrome c biogenesis protein ResB [Brachymonas]|uniref:cytochrome c biogenesis protein ResB n=1 Tax=Brachymonas TaxID=28219 RepID=UPI002E79ABD4|nr:cytochrome c biogenesis protein ResB [Brachymonas sp. J145]MEE1652930.1 cytochrome c biogenesis protein ResB [Brachymonas sp. J145]